ncbi:MAG: hypothetical protein COA44_06230 [Arcobacter sp.]|nr:MAG: hypothetical protein COA44_06230 [Arcobacter sp.]
MKIDDRSGKVIDNTTKDFYGFDSSLNGEIFLGIDEEDGGVYTRFNYTLDDLKSSKYNEIDQMLFTRQELPVIVSGVQYHGGYVSALKLDSEYRLAERIGVTEVIFTDTHNDEHVLSLVDANTVITEVSKKYRSDFLHKQKLVRLAQSAQDKTELDAIAW